MTDVSQKIREHITALTNEIEHAGATIKQIEGAMTHWVTHNNGLSQKLIEYNDLLFDATDGAEGVQIPVPQETQPAAATGTPPGAGEAGDTPLDLATARTGKEAKAKA